MDLIPASGLQLGVLAVLIALAAMAGFIGGVTLANNEHRKDEQWRPWTEPVALPPAQYASTRVSDQQAPPAVVNVHVHHGAPLPHSWSPAPVIDGQVVELPAGPSVVS